MRRASLGTACVLAVVLVMCGATPASAARADAVRDAQYWLDDYGIRDAWQVTRGAGVTIAVIDTGIGSPPELRGAVIGGADFSGVGTSDGRTPVGQERQHGTLVASLAAGRGTGDGDGVIGAAPEASLLALSLGFGASSDEQIAAAVRWAVDNGADIINMSLTRNTLDWPASWDDAFLYAFENDVVVLAAAGNRGSGTFSVGAPATMPGVLTVAGLDRDGRASQSASAQGVTIGVSAPSESLVGVMPDGSHVRWDGTSGATPIVAGILALVRAAHPDLDAANVIQRVIATAHDAGDAGADVTYGFGIVDAYAAVTAHVDRVDANPMGDLAEWVRVNRPHDSGAEAPVAGPAPVVFPEPDEAESPLAGLIPSALLLRQVGAPLLGLLLVLFIVGGVILGSIRAFGAHLRKR